MDVVAGLLWVLRPDVKQADREARRLMRQHADAWVARAVTRTEAAGANVELKLATAVLRGAFTAEFDEM